MSPERFAQFMAKVEVTDRCWFWRGYVDKDGYGRVSLHGRQGTLVHRAMFEHAVGEIPEGLTIDHLCRRRSCVNPGHLDVVTAAENMRRSIHAGTKPTCPSGHTFTESNTYWRSDGTRSCRVCQKESAARHQERREVPA